MTTEGKVVTALGACLMAFVLLPEIFPQMRERNRKSNARISYGPPLPPCYYLVSDLADFITRVEGVRASANNPGGLMARGKLLTFQEPWQGEMRMRALIERLVLKSLTLQQFFAIYAPPGAARYALLAEQALDIPANQPLLERCD